MAFSSGYDLFLDGIVLLLSGEQLRFQPLCLNFGHLSVVIALFVAVGLQLLQQSVSDGDVPRLQ